MKFIDHHNYDGRSFYTVTNEEPFVHANLIDTHKLEKGRFKRAGAICSGGEIPLFVLLSRCKEVFAVDHSLQSLAITFTKAILLEQLGSKDLYNKFLRCNNRQLEGLLFSVKDKLPERLQSAYMSDTYKIADVRREWGYIQPSSLEGALKNLRRLTLVHGDFNDLKDFGPFDLLYLSNAMVYSGRNGMLKPQIPELASEDALILHTGSPDATRSVEDCQHLETVKGLRTSWDFHAYRYTTPVKKVEKRPPHED